ncbi:MAG: hypothetical protein ACK4M4_00695 [Flavobacterium sp.]
MKNRFSIFIFNIIILCFFSCKSENEKKLIGYSNGKYWDLIKIKDYKYYKPKYSAYFGKNGDYLYYFFNVGDSNNTKERIKYDFGDVIYPEKWFFENDSIVSIQGFRYRILKLTNTHFEIQNLEVPDDIVEYKLSSEQ